MLKSRPKTPKGWYAAHFTGRNIQIHFYITIDCVEILISISVEVRSEDSVSHRLLFDPGHGLEERLIGEQFT